MTHRQSEAAGREDLQCRHGDNNFAKDYVASWSGYFESATRKKQKMPAGSHRALTKYIEGGPLGDPGCLVGSTFDHIRKYLESGTVSNRLQVALADFGYTMEELQNARAKGTTAIDIAREVVARGVLDLPTVEE